MNEFDILIGVDMTNAESKIKSSLKKIGEDYKIEVNLAIANESQFVKDIKSIQKLLGNIDKVNVDLGLDKEIKEAKSEAEKLANEIVNSMNKAKKSADSYNDELEESNRLLKTQLKLIEQADGKQKVVASTTVGTKNNNVTTTKTNDKLSQTVYNDNVEGERVKREKEISQQKKFQEQITKTSLDNLAKVDDLERQGLANQKSVQKLRRLNEELSKLEVSDLNKIKSKLGEIESQHRLINEQIKKRKFVDAKDEAVRAVRKKSNDTLDTKTLGKETEKLEGKISDIKNVKSYKELEKAIRSATEEYDKLMAKQKLSIDNEKVANQIANNRIKGNNKVKSDEESVKANDWKALQNESERVGQNQLKINKATEDWNNKIKELRQQGFVKESDLENARKLIQNLKSDSQNLKEEIKQVNSALNQVNQKSVASSKKDEKVKDKKVDNNTKSNELYNVPKEQLDNFKRMNNALDYNSSAKELKAVTTELQRIQRLHNDVNKAIERDNTLTQQSVNSLDRNLKTLDNMSYKNNQEVLNKEKAKNVLQETLEINRQLNQLTGNLSENEKMKKSYLESQLKANKDILKNNRTRKELQSELVNLEQQLNNNKRNNVQLSQNQKQSIQNEITALQRKIQTQKELETRLQNEARIRNQLRDAIVSNSYRAGRGLDNNPDERREINRQAQNLRSQLDNLNRVSGDDFIRQERDIRNSMDRMNQDAQRFRNNIRDASNSITGQLGNAMKKVPIWMSAMGLFYGAVNQVQLGFQGLIDFDTAMTNLQKVTEASTQELKEFKQTAHELGMDLGVTATDVVNATAEFQKIGFNLQEASQLGKSSLLYANVGDMSVEDAQKNMISAVKGFGIEVDASGREVTKLVDIFNEVGNNYAITSAGIGEALRRSSAVLNEAGNSVEQSVALVTAANTTIQDPARVGTALKTISMRLRGVNEEGKIVTELVPEIESSLGDINQKLGLIGEEALTLKKDENTFLTTFEMFEKLSKQWDKLTDMERANLVEQIGGKEQGAIVASMINNWSDATNSYETALNSAGSAQKEFNNYTESFQYKIGRLKSAMEGFWQALINDDAIKSAIDGLTSIVEQMTKLVSMDVYGGIPMLLQLGTFIAFLASPKLRMAVVGVSAITASLDGLVSLISKIASRIPALMALMIVAYGVGKAIEGLYNLATKESRERKERINIIEEEITALEELKSANESLDKSYGDERSFGSGVTEFGKLRDKGSGRTTEENIQYEEMSKKIEDTMPQFIAYYDDYGNAIFKSTEEMQKLNSELEKNLALKNETLLEENVADTDFGELQKKVDEAKKIFEENKKYSGYSEEYSQSKEWIENEMKNVEKGTKEYKEKVKEFVNSFPEEMQTISYTNQIRNALLYEGKDAGLEQVDSVIKQVKDANTEIAKELEKSKGDITLMADDYRTYLGQAFELALSKVEIKPNSNEYLLADKMHTYLSDNIEMFNGKDITEILDVDKLSKMLKDSIEELDAVDLSISDLLNVDSGDGEKTASAIQKVIDKLEHNGGSSWLINALKELRLEHLKTTNQLNNTNMRTNFDFGVDVLPVIDTLQNEISGLDSAYRTLAEGQQLSNSEIFNLIKQYPQLNKNLQVHNGYLRLSKDAIKELAKVKEEQAKQDLRVARQKAITAKAEAEAQVKSSKTQIAALKLLGDAKAKSAKVDQQTASELTKKATELFNAGHREQGQEIMKQANMFQNTVNQIANFDAEIQAIDALLGADYSGNLGSLGSVSSDKDKGKDKNSSKQQAQDAVYIVDRYTQKVNELNQLIERQKLLRERLASGSADYNNTLNKEISLLTQKKTAIDNEVKSLESQIKARKIQQYGLIQLGQEDNSTARKKNAELQQEIDEAKERLAELRTESMQVFNEISDVRYAYIESVLEGFEQQREQWTDDIAYAEYSMSLYDKKTNEYRKAMLEQQGYMKKQLDIHQKELDYLELQRKSHKLLNSYQKNELNALIRDRREAIYSLKEELQGFNMMMIESKQSVYSNDREQWTDDIAYTEYMMDLFIDSSKGYRKWASEKEGLVKKQLGLQQQELDMLELEKKMNKSLTNSQREELNALIRKAREDVYSLSSELISIQSDIAKSRLDEALYYMETESNAYAKKISEINDKIKYEVDEDNYQDEVKYLRQITALRKGEIADIKSNITRLKELHSQNIDNVHVAEEISNEIKTWEANLISAQNSLADVSLNIKNIYKQLADEYVELYKKQLELMKKADEEYYDDRLEAESKAHESRMNQIEKEMSTLEKAYEIANRAIDRESSSKSYNDEMKKLEKEALELKKQIDILSLDDSYEAKKKKSELVKKLTEVEMGMADKQYDRTVDLRKQSLEDDLEIEKEMLENKKSSLEKEYEAWVEKMEDKKEKQLKYWEDELNNERKFAKMREEIMDGNFDSIINTMQGWVTDVQNNMQLAGKAVEDGFVYQIEQAIKKFNELRNLGGISSIVNNSGTTNLDGENVNGNRTGSGMAIGTVNQDGSNFGQEKAPKGRLTTGIFEKRESAEWLVQNLLGTYMASTANVIQDGKSFRADAVFESVERANKVLADMKRLNKVKAGYVSAFDTGGYTGDWSSNDGKLAFLHQKELVLNAKQTEDILNTAKVVEKLKNILPKLNIMTPSVKNEQPQEVSKVTNNKYELTVQIDNMSGNKKDAERVSEQIINNLKRTKGGRF